MGKLTVAKALELSTGFRLLHDHLVVDLVTAVCGVANPFAVELNVALRRLIYETAAKNNLSGLITTFVYRGSQFDKILNGYTEMLKKYNSEVFL